MQEPARRITGEPSECIVRACTFMAFVSAVCWRHSMRSVLIAVNKYGGLTGSLHYLALIILRHVAYYLYFVLFQFYVVVDRYLFNESSILFSMLFRVTNDVDRAFEPSIRSFYIP